MRALRRGRTARPARSEQPSAQPSALPASASSTLHSTHNLIRTTCITLHARARPQLDMSKLGSEAKLRVFNMSQLTNLAGGDGLHTLDVSGGGRGRLHGKGLMA